MRLYWLRSLNCIETFAMHSKCGRKLYGQEFFSFDQLTQISFKLVDYPQVSSWLVTWDGISNLVINLIKAHMIKENYS